MVLPPQCGGDQKAQGPTIEFPCLELNPCVHDLPLKLEEGAVSLNLLHQIDLCPLEE